ncbi:MAG: adenylate/guanylate cyclase domain-containing protein [Deltaproteobacteria bacterium]|nr:adenylate/guanylate cyclase domain-containing protein [Deltaproteobacteria bacterium]
MSDTTFLIDLQVKINELMSLKYDVSQITRIPTKQDVTFGDKACAIQAACLFIDIRHSTKLLRKFRVSDVANLLKSFHYICSSIIKKNTGEVRSFNGDSVLAIFTEETCCDCAVSSAFNIKYSIGLLLTSKYKIENDLDFGIGIDYGKIFVVKVGNRGEFNNDLVWIGDAINGAAKMGNNSNKPNNIKISEAVYKKLIEYNKYKPLHKPKVPLPPKPFGRKLSKSNKVISPIKPRVPIIPRPIGKRSEIWSKTPSSPIIKPLKPIIYYSSYERPV